MGLVSHLSVTADLSFFSRMKATVPGEDTPDFLIFTQRHVNTARNLFRINK